MDFAQVCLNFQDLCFLVSGPTPLSTSEAGSCFIVSCLFKPFSSYMVHPGPRPSPRDHPPPTAPRPEPNLSPSITVPCQSQSIRDAPSLLPTQCVVLVLFSEWLMNSSTVAIFLPVSPAGSPGPGGLFTRHHPQHRTETQSLNSGTQGRVAHWLRTQLLSLNLISIFSCSSDFG